MVYYEITFVLQNYFTMNKKKTIQLTGIVFFSFIASSAFSQNALNVAGNSATINGITFDYSIGEMTIVSTERNANLIVTQGLLQPTSLGSKTESTPTSHSLTFDRVKVYPNPTTDMLYVESFEDNESTADYQLYDATGKLMISKNVPLQVGANKISFDMQSYAAGTYYLMIKQSKDENSTLSFKILKTN